MCAPCAVASLTFSNAGVAAFGDSEEDWERSWRVNTMAHVWAARALLPRWLERGSGHFVQIVSAAGLLTQIGSAPYAVTKHAALAFAEWLHLTYYDRGIRVSAVCPMGVKTELLDNAVAKGAGFLLDGLLAPAAVADAVATAVDDGRFLVLPHPEVLEHFRFKAADYEKWLRGMRKLNAKWPVTPS
jgi:NAD(P)-dependent dehydrogenase (short-subunit alcohol dehydrogenase family)